MNHICMVRALLYLSRNPKIVSIESMHKYIQMDGIETTARLIFDELLTHTNYTNKVKFGRLIETRIMLLRYLRVIILHMEKEDGRIHK